MNVIEVRQTENTEGKKIIYWDMKLSLCPKHLTKDAYKSVRTVKLSDKFPAQVPRKQTPFMSPIHTNVYIYIWRQHATDICISFHAPHADWISVHLANLVSSSKLYLANVEPNKEPSSEHRLHRSTISVWEILSLNLELHIDIKVSGFSVRIQILVLFIAWGPIHEGMDFFNVSKCNYEPQLV
jgi:hypothetical protein